MLICTALSVCMYVSVETGGRESRLHGAVRHLKREALKFAVVFCVYVRKLEQGTPWHPEAGQPIEGKLSRLFRGTGQRSVSSRRSPLCTTRAIKQVD